MDFSHFDISGIREFNYLFENCSKLKYIDFSKIHLSSSINATLVFKEVNEKFRLICNDKNLVDQFEENKNNILSRELNQEIED